MIFSALSIGIICGKWTKNQFIHVSQKLFSWLAIHLGYTNNTWCQQLSQWHVMPTVKPAVKHLTTPHMTTPTIMPDMATPDTQGNTHDYVYDYTSWLCPKTTPTNNFFWRLIHIKGVVETWEICWYTKGNIIPYKYCCNPFLGPPQKYKYIAGRN
jgi:hypothetical protein